MLNYKEKMFREKPYTQCFECIQGSRLKCKKCMLQLINDVLQHRQKTEQNKEQTKPRLNKLYRLWPRKEEHTLEIKTNFGLWMNRVSSRRKEQDDPLRSTSSNWPRKKATDPQKTMKLEMPKLQSWERRLLSRFSMAEQSAKNEPKVYELSMR